jgi:DNA-binding CsgD family transcriptional regulator
MPAAAAAAACPAHPDAPVREFRADGPAGLGTYRFCVPLDGRMHLLGPAAVEDAPSPQDRIRNAAVRASARLDGDHRLLSVAELEALQAAAQGLTTQQTADVLGKSAETVKSQRNGILLKLQARNIVHAVCLATAAGLVDVDEATPVERRRDPRVLPASELAIVAYAAGVAARAGRLRDASAGGVTFESREGFAENDLLIATILRAGERHGVSGLRLRVVAVRPTASGQVVHAAFTSPPPDRWLDELALDAPLRPRR